MAKKRSDRERSPFGARMFQARTEAKLGQVAVATKLGISQGTLSELEGMAASSGRVAEFAELYKVDAKWLATGEAADARSGSLQPARQLTPEALRVARIYDEVSDRDRRYIDAAADSAASPASPKPATVEPGQPAPAPKPTPAAPG